MVTRPLSHGVEQPGDGANFHCFGQGVAAGAASAEGLLDAAKTVAAMTGPITAAVGAVLALLG